jgi:hypothetical protein
MFKNELKLVETVIYVNIETEDEEFYHTLILHQRSFLLIPIRICDYTYIEP